MPTRVTTTVQVKSIVPGVGKSGGAAPPSTAGQPIGLLLALTKAS